MANTNNNVIFRDITKEDIVFRNFSGRESDYNPAGKRTFNIILSEEKAEELREKGYRVKMLKPIPGVEGPDIPSVKVHVSYGYVPPKIYMCTDTSKVLLDIDTVGNLDAAELVQADIEVVPYRSKIAKFNADGLFSAYLKTGYFTIQKDPFEEKYAELD